MAVGSGIGASFGVAAESTFGTYVAPTRWYQGTFNVKKVLNTQEIFGVAAGLEAATDEVVITEMATAHMETEIKRAKYGLLLQQLFGSTGTPVQQAATIAYLQSGAWSDNRGKYMTVQEGVPNTGGTVNPMTGLGSKLKTAEFSCGVDENLKLTADWDCRQQTEGQSLAAPSFTEPNLPFHFGQMSVKLGNFASEAAIQGITKATVSIARGQYNPFYAGNAGLMSEPVWNEMGGISVSLDADLVTKADLHDRFTGHTATSMVIEWVGPIIATTYAYTLRFKFPRVYIGGGLDEVSGPDVIKGSVPIKIMKDPTNGYFLYEYISTDTSV